MNFVNFCSTLRANIPAISPNYLMKLHKKLHQLIFLVGIIILVCLDDKITVKTSILANMPRTRDLSYEERVAIITLKESGYSFRKIAEQLDCSKSTAFYIYKMYRETNSAEKRKRTGRKKKLDAREERMVCRTARHLRFGTLKEVTGAVNKRCPNKNASHRLVRQVLHKYGLKSHPRKRKPYVSLTNRQYRLHWASTMTFSTLDNWKDVVFSDECRFGLRNDSGVLRVWRSSQEASNPEFFQPTFSNSVSVMVWGCIGPNRVGQLVVCERSVNSEYYCQILQDNLFQSVTRIYRNRNKPFIFQQDSATTHTSEYTRIFFVFAKFLFFPGHHRVPT